MTCPLQAWQLRHERALAARSHDAREQGLSARFFLLVSVLLLLVVVVVVVVVVVLVFVLF